MKKPRLTSETSLALLCLAVEEFVATLFPKMPRSRAAQRAHIIQHAILSHFLDEAKPTKKDVASGEGPG